MNKLEELSNENKDNYERYLKRMTESIKYSTKGLIPVLAQEGKNILDVGCGSGVLMFAMEKENSKSKITGIDMNIDAINKLKKLNNHWTLYHADFMKMNSCKFDTIIFSSILHEISSYHSDKNKRFTEIPIYEAFQKSNKLLEDDGVIILRDGILTSLEKQNKKLRISFKNPSDSIWLYKFQKDFRGFDKLNINKDIIVVGNNKYVVSECFLKEFLCTYTWGPESYNREINERFGILTKMEWQRLLRETGFKIETIIESREEYEKYLLDRITIMDGINYYEYPNMTITIKARKVKKLER